jgi:spermidine/putrescine transport system ATP-binding protein
VTPLVELSGVTLSYGKVPVLKGIDLSIADGEFLVVLGPSGSGKTTILRLIGGFLEPTGGSITLDGRDIASLPINRRPFNTVFQDYALFPHMTVGENVAYGLMVRGVGRPETARRVGAALERVALAEFRDRYPSQLSGGQQQRVALARAIICEPRLVLLDEPLGALDAELRRQMQRFLKTLQRELRTTFLFITHDQEEAITMADRICVMRGGLIEQIGTPEAVYYRPATPAVARFFGDNNLIEGTSAGGLAIDTPVGRLSAATVAQSMAAAGSAAAIAVRPEAIRLVRTGDATTGDNRIDAIVRQVEFVGPMTQVTAVLATATGGEGPAILVKQPSRGDGPEVAVGDRVAATFAAADAHLLAAS